MAESRSPDDVQGQKSVTIRDVAKQAGVSVATVSRVLNGSPKVDPGIAERVHTVVAQLNYQPSKVARMLAGRGSTLLGLLVTDMQNPFYLDLIRGVEEVAQQHNYLVIVCNTMENTQKEENYLKVLSAEPIAGVIVVPTRGQIAGIEYLRERNIPLVAVDRRVEDRSIDCVIIDNIAAAREAVTHLITNGYRRIGVIGGPKTVTNANERILGYRQALQQAGIVREAALEQRGVLIGDNVGIALANRLLDLDPPVEAIFAANNRLTIGAMRAIHAHQMRIPEDIALVGFDDIQWAVPEQVSVTTVIQSAYELGSAAANRLIQRLQKPDAPRQEIVLQHQLAAGISSTPREARETFPRSISARVEKNKKKASRRVSTQETFSD